MATKTIRKNATKHACHEIINDFFETFSLPEARDYLISTIKAGETKKIWKEKSPTNLLFFFEKLKELMRAIFLITGNDYKEKNAILFVEGAPDIARFDLYCGACNERYSPWDYFARGLSNEEYNDPYIALQICTSWASEKEWKCILKDILNYALDINTLQENGSQIEVLHVTHFLQKMLEASHLIMIRALRQS